MKRQLLITAALGVLASSAGAQAPAAFNYQGIARNTAGAPLASRTLSLRISIHDGAATGPVLFQETHRVTTNAYGLYNLSIGEGTPVSGSLGGLNWGSGSRHLEVELDPAGGSAYISIGNSKLMSVPYALHAGSAPAPTLRLSNDTLSAGANSVKLPTTTLTISNDTIRAGGSYVVLPQVPVYTAGSGITISAARVIDVANLAGDVTGAIGNTRVVRMQGMPVSTNVPATAEVLKFSGTDWRPMPDMDNQQLSISGNLLSLTGSTSVSLPSFSAGSGISISTGNVISAANLSGDVTGSPASTSVNGLRGRPLSAAVPSASQVLKYNGTDWAPAQDQDNQQISISGNTVSLTGGGSVSLPVATAYTGGAGITVSGSNVISADNLAGDVTGATGATIVTALRGTPVAAGTISNGQVLKYNGSAWAPAADLDQDNQQLSISGNVVSLTNGGTVSLPAAPVYTGGTGITVSGSNVISAANLGGDVSGTPAANSVTAIRGTTIDTTGMITGDMLKYDGNAWKPTRDTGVVSAATAGYLPKMSSGTRLVNSLIYETGGKIGFNTTAPSANTLFEMVNGSASPAVSTLRVSRGAQWTSTLIYPGQAIAGETTTFGSFGVMGRSQYNVGVYGESGQGVIAASFASSRGAGVMGQNSSSGPGVWGRATMGIGGYFEGAYGIITSGWSGINTTTPTSVLDVAGSMSLAITTVSANYTATAGDHTILAMPAAATPGFTVTLPAPASCKGRIYIIRRLPAAPPATSSVPQAVTVTTPAGNIWSTGATSAAVSMSSYNLIAGGEQVLRVQSTCSDWISIAQN